jgi:oxygen-dependent protoporphyrinogen oxidase
MNVASVVVVGAGITGLAAAARASEHGCRVDLIEATDSVGGKLRTHSVDGITLDAGAESVLARRPEALDAMTAAGLGDSIVHPSRSGAALWLERMVPLPSAQLLGIPTDSDDEAFTQVLSREGLRRLRNEPAATGFGDDVSVGELVDRQLGPEVVARLVEPLLGGVYAGRAEEIGVDEALPGIRDRVARRGSLTSAAAELRTEGTGPVFATVVGGLGHFAQTWSNVLSRDPVIRLHLKTQATAIGEDAGRWMVTAESGEQITADAVVLATPSFSTAPLLQSWESARTAGQVAGGVQYASVALVTAVFESADVERLPEGTGFLVPPITGRMTKAATFVSRKWEWVHDAAPGREVLRFSVGRFGDEAALTLNDSELTAAVLAEVSEELGLRRDPLAAAVRRWKDSLPQYPPGHLERVARLRSRLPRGVEVCGAAWDGVGIAACIASGREAVDRLVAPTM